MRGRIISAAALALFASSASATVTFTLTLGDNGSGTPTSNSFAVYAQDSADNGGIFGIGVDLTNATFAGMNNRLPAALIRLPGDPPDMERSWGFRVGRVTSNADGKISGVQDFSDPNMVPLYGFGQTGGTTPGGGIIISSQGSIPYAARALVGTGTWSGGCPAFQIASVDNKVSVWNDTSGSHSTRLDTIVYRQSSVVLLPCVTMAQFVGTANIPLHQNLGFGNLIYGGPILAGAPQPVGSAEVQGAGDEAENNYFLARLTGTDAQIAAALDALPNSIPESDPRFKQLKTVLGSQFNALFEIPNIPGPKFFNWDFGNYPGVALDRLAAVPEPGIVSAIGVLFLAGLRRRRRIEVQRTGCA